MRYRRITSTIITIFLGCHIIIGLYYGYITTHYLNTIRHSTIDAEEAQNYTETRGFKYWFFDAEMKYQHKLRKGEFAGENKFLIFGFAKRSISGASEECMDIGVFNVKSKEEFHYDLCNSSIILPVEKEGLVHILLSIFGLVLIIYSFKIFYQLRRVVNSVKNGSPFINENVTRLKRISYMIIALPIGILFIELGLYLNIVSRYILLDSDLRPNFNFNLGLFIGGIILLFISETYKQGVKIKEDQELTI